MKILFLTLISIVHLAAGQNDCLPTRCSPSGPIVRFPFGLKDRQPEHCGYPGFDLSCSASGRTELDLQFPLTASANNIVLPLQITVSVGLIDYAAQRMLASYARGRSCLPKKLAVSNSSASPFEVEALGYDGGYTLFNCSNARDYWTQITCLSGHNHQVIAFASTYEITSLLPYSSCFKMYNISYVPDSAITGRDDEYGDRFYLRWSKPDCRNCEEGKYCRLRSSGAADETECFSPQQHEHGGSKNQKPLIASITAGTVLLVFAMISSYFILISIKRKKEEHKKIEKILENHKGMRPRRYSYADIKRITHSFKEKLSQGLHKGMLIDEKTPVAVKMINGSEGINFEDFIDQVHRIGRMQHLNMLRLIGYCVDGPKRALVYEFLPGGTIENFSSSQRQSQKLHQIALGTAKGIDYVHQECSQENLSLDISPQNIFLDSNFGPKILVLPTNAAQEAMEYVAPELLSSSYDSVSQKADVYSFGLLLLDIAGRRRNFHGADKGSRGVYFPEWIIDHGEKGAIQIEQEEEEQENGIVEKLSIVGLWCIQWFPSDRPSIKEVIQMLEGDGTPVMPLNPFASVSFSKDK